MAEKTVRSPEPFLAGVRLADVRDRHRPAQSTENRLDRP